MEKEVTPKTTTLPKAPEYKNIGEKPAEQSGEKVAQKTNTPIKKPEYKNIGKASVGQSIKKSIPKALIPTKRLATILGFIFLAVIILALVQIPYGEILSGNLEIKVGYPLTFLNFGIETADGLPLKPMGLIIDIIIYLILAYIIDVIINLMLIANKNRIRRQEGKAPKVHAPVKPSLAEKAVEKVILKKEIQQPKVPNAVHPVPND